ncbi:MAG: diacylglycerol kinase family protein [Leptospiraceae bacterium]|nr:diacylglycerol kinase family protein [Leptospiraceae bacterium]
MKQEKFSFKKRLKSFTYAFNGFRILFREEHNARIHLVFAILALISGFYFKITTTEWISIIFVIGLVFILEILNSAIENICDFISPEYHETIKKVKDLSAAAVLFGAIVSVFVGLIVFLPYLRKLLISI